MHLDDRDRSIFCEEDYRILQECQQGNFSRLLFLKTQFTQEELLEALFLAWDTPKEQKVKLIKRIAVQCAFWKDALNEDYKAYLRQHNDAVREVLLHWFHNNSLWFNSFRSYNNHFWSTYGGRSLRSPCVSDPSHEWYGRHIAMIQSHRYFCTFLCVQAGIDLPADTLTFFESIGG